MKNRVTKFVSINLGDTSGSGSDDILNLALGGTDVKVDIDGTSTVFKSDGSLLDVSSITNTLQFSKSSAQVTMSSTDLQLLAKVNAYKYRNKDLTVYWGSRNNDGSISNVRTLFKGLCSGHTANKSVITLSADSVWNKFEQKRGVATSAGEQDALILNSDFDVDPSTIDNGFDFVDRDYSKLSLGDSTVNQITHQSSTDISAVYQEQVPGRVITNGNPLGSNFVRPLVVGRSTVPSQLVHAFNPELVTLFSVYPNMNLTAKGTGVGGAQIQGDYLTLVFALGEGEVEDVSIIIGDVAVSPALTFNNFGIKQSDGAVDILTDSTVGIADGKRTLITAEFFNGSYSQSAINNVVLLDPNTEWTSDHRCIGTALCAITIANSTNRFNGIPDITFNLGGKKVKSVEKSGDVYSLSSSADSITLRTTEDKIGYLGVANDGSTVTSDYPVSQSPSRAILDILLDKPYGLGFSESDIDLESFYNAYQNEIDISGNHKGSQVLSSRGLFQGAINHRDTIRSLLDTSQANISWIDGKVTIVPNQYLGTDTATKSAISTKTFDESNIMNGIDTMSFSPQGSSSVYNQVNVLVPVVNGSAGEEYQLTLRSSTALAEDNGDKSELDMNLPIAGVFLDSAGVAIAETLEPIQEIARSRLRASRLFVQGSFNIDYWSNSDLNVGDVIVIDSKRFNFTDTATKLAKVISLTYSKLGMVTVLWAEYSNLIYDVASADITSLTRTSFPSSRFNTPATFDPAGQTPGSPVNLQVSESLVITNPSAGVKVQVTVFWDAPPNDLDVSYVLEYKKSSETTFTVLPIITSRSVNLDDFGSGQFDFRVKTLSFVGTSSGYTSLTNVDIEGLTAKPPKPENFLLSASGSTANLSWSLPANTNENLDVLNGGYAQIRFSSNTVSATWDSSAIAVNSVAMPATSTTAPLAIGTYLIKFFDSSGNESDQPAITTNTHNATGVNAVTTIQEDPAFSGTKTNCLVEGSILAKTDGQTTMNYSFSSTVDLNSVKTVTIVPNLTSVVTKDDFDFCGIADVCSIADLCSSEESSTQSIKVRHTNDDPNDSPTYTEIQDLGLGSYTARAFQFSFEGVAASDATIAVSKLGVVIDTDDVIQTGTATTAALAETTVVFLTEFYSGVAQTDVPLVFVNINNGSVGDTVQTSSISATSFKVRTFDLNNNPVSRSISWQAIGQ